MSRFLHTMIRVGDLERSVAFYTEPARHEGACAGATCRTASTRWPSSASARGERRRGDRADLQLRDVTKYELGNAFGHLAVGVPNVRAACDRLRAAGGKVTREAGPVKFGTTVIAFIEDPDGYKIELIERG